MKKIVWMVMIAFVTATVGFAQQSDEDALSDLVGDVESGLRGRDSDTVDTTETTTQTATETVTETSTTETDGGTTVNQNTQVEVNVTVEQKPSPAPAPVPQTSSQTQVQPKPVSQRSQSEEDVEIGGFGGQDWIFTAIDGQEAVLVGGHGAVLLGDVLYFGGGGYGLSSNVPVDAPGVPGARLSFGYGGLMAGLLIGEGNKFNVSAYVFGGVGGVSWDNEYLEGGFDNNGRAVFVFEPGFDINFQPFNWLMGAAGIRYRNVYSLSEDMMEVYPDGLLSGFSLSLTVRAGSF